MGKRLNKFCNKYKYSTGLLIVFFVFSLHFTALAQEQTTDGIFGFDITDVVVDIVDGVTDTIDDVVENISTVADEYFVDSGEVLGEVSEENEDEEYIEEEEEFYDEEPVFFEEETFQYIKPEPKLKTRKFEKKINLNNEATHRCEAENFKVDISDQDSSLARIMLHREDDSFYDLEIGGLPNGIDVTFSKNSDYLYSTEMNEEYVDLEIENETGSQKGDFNVSIIYTKKDLTDSSSICQINIINQ